MALASPLLLANAVSCAPKHLPIPALSRPNRADWAERRMFRPVSAGAGLDRGPAQPAARGRATDSRCHTVALNGRWTAETARDHDDLRKNRALPARSAQLAM